MLSVLLLLAGCNHPPELELPRELGPDLAETVQDRAAGVQQARLGRHLAVSLDAQEELGHVRVRNFVACHQNIGVLLEVLGEHVAQCVVFLFERKV